MAAFIHRDINLHVMSLYKKFGNADSETEKMFVNLFQSVEKLQMYNDKDFELLWQTEMREKEEIKNKLDKMMTAAAVVSSAVAPCSPYAAECVFAKTDMYQEMTSAAASVPRRGVLNPEEEMELESIEISSIYVAPENNTNFN
jgi:hypothetical protein